MSTFPCVRCGRPVRRDTTRTPPHIACPRCRFLIFDYPRPCVGALVLKGDALLVLERGHAPRRGYMDLPGGFLEAGEDLETAARRELREETGLTVGTMTPLGLYWDTYPLDGFGAFPTLNLYWVARWRRGVPRAADDAAEARWLPLADVRRARARFAWAHMTRVVRDVGALVAGRRAAIDAGAWSAFARPVVPARVRPARPTPRRTP
jgi:8-oxo-dGTP diphosphatase